MNKPKGREIGGEIYFTKEEAAQYLGKSYWTIHNYIKKGYLKATTLGYPRLIRKKDIDEMIKDSRK